MKTLYKLDGMTCGHCAMTVEKEFSKEGITAKADIKSNSVSMETPLSEETFKKMKLTLEEEGYELGNPIS